MTKTQYKFLRRNGDTLVLALAVILTFVYFSCGGLHEWWNQPAALHPLTGKEYPYSITWKVNVYEEGILARRLDKTVNDNPYKPSTFSGNLQQRHVWNEGWLDMDAAIKAKGTK